MTLTQTKSEFLVDSLVEVLNNEWKVRSIESGHKIYHQLETEVGRKYIKIWTYTVMNGMKSSTRSCWMFVDKNGGECYKPASYKAPAKGVRFYIDSLANNANLCDPYGSFLYLR